MIGARSLRPNGRLLGASAAALLGLSFACAYAIAPAEADKVAKVEAPLKENLAAGILQIAGWKPGIPLLDPMCGSGTFLLEAAQQSLAEAAGLARDAGEFGLQRRFDKLCDVRLLICVGLPIPIVARP